MKGILTVFGFTFLEFARKKSFIISTVVILALVAGGLCLPTAVDRLSGLDAAPASAGSRLQTVYFVDPGGILPRQAAENSSFLPGYRIEFKDAADIGSLKKAVQADDKKALAVLSLRGGLPYFDFYVKRAGSGPNPGTLAEAIQNAYAMQLLQMDGLPADTIAKALSAADYKVNELGKGYLSGMFSSLLITLLLFFSIYLYGYWVAMSIASEKTSRVMELLVTSTKPSRIIIGKSAAMGALGLGQLSLILLTAAAVYSAAFPKDFSLFGEQLNFSNVTPFSLVMAIVYFILGYALYAMMNAVVGSTVSKAEDVQSAMIPISMISVLAFYLSYSAMLMPDGAFASAVSVIPFTAPFSMPARLLISEVSPGEIVCSVLIMVASIVLLTWFSVRLYSSAVLHYGSRLKFADLFRISKKPAARL